MTDNFVSIRVDKVLRFSSEVSLEKRCLLENIQYFVRGGVTAESQAIGIWLKRARSKTCSPFVLSVQLSIFFKSHL